ncbi:unnamed protein product [Ciceribacter sp. T2.26MG-112.2]|uniref:hypothetical protein n=1 Tax=Ciceribacter sp. T2.26MG-112.2 TaxID=3137154 RepID=UPI000E185DF1|nr:hypothetical protein [Ciceribacter naphthalenivorans]SSC73120.1 unnamed protein product [Ciceribacter naphthalenivorans]
MSSDVTLIETGAAIFALWFGATVISVVAYQRPTMPAPIAVSTLMFGAFALTLVAALVIIAAATGAA